MDRKGLLVLVLSFLLLLLWMPLVNKLYPPVPAPHLTNEVARSTNGTGTSAAPPTSTAASPSASPSPPLVPPGSPEETAVLENEFLKMTFTSHGGGIKLIELKKHFESISCRPSATESNSLVTLNTQAPLPILSLLGDSTLIQDGLFALQASPGKIQAEKLLGNGLFLVKEFHLQSNHLVSAKVRIENRSEQPVALPEQRWTVGTATPINSRDDGTYLGTFWYDQDKKSSTHTDAAWFANRTLGCIPGTPRTFYDGGMNNVGWAAVHNQFFTIAIVPKTPASRLHIVQTNLPPPSAELLQQDSKTIKAPFGMMASLVFAGTNLAARAVLEQDFLIYAGPKEYNTLARLGQELNNNLDLIMDYGGFFGFFAKALLLSMNGLYSLHVPYGLAIIIITIIIKLIFWPLTTASTRSMKRMAALQPQMKALQERFKDDPVKMNRKLMEFMKENKVSPLGGCLPMLLQIPVFFGFFQMIRSATELRGAQFLWACDLSKADTIFVIPGVQFPVNPLPIIMGFTMLWQARLTPLSPGMDPIQQKMMKYMPLMFLFILYNFSAGLTLYWTVQNILTIAQTKLTRTKEEPAASSAPAPAAAVQPKPIRPASRPKKKK